MREAAPLGDASALWTYTYGDLMSLLLVLFVFLFSRSTFRPARHTTLGTDTAEATRAELAASPGLIATIRYGVGAHEPRRGPIAERLLAELAEAWERGELAGVTLALVSFTRAGSTALPRQDLAVARAEWVRDRLAERGVPRERFAIIDPGPLATGDPRAGEDDRVEVSVLRMLAGREDD